jgi:hypothetical protein
LGHDRPRRTGGRKGPNERGSLDFVADQFIDGCRLRILVVVGGRECLALAGDTSIFGIRALRLNSISAPVAHGKP